MCRSGGVSGDTDMILISPSTGSRIKDNLEAFSRVPCHAQHTLFLRTCGRSKGLPQVCRQDS